MTRRAWWTIPVALFAAVRSSGVAAPVPVCEEGINQFGCLYRAWADLVWKNNAGRPNTLDAAEVATWQSVRHAWREFEKQINKMYGV